MVSDQDKETRIAPNVAPSINRATSPTASQVTDDALTELQATVQVLRHEQRTEASVNEAVTQWLVRTQPHLEEAQIETLTRKLVQTGDIGTLDSQTYTELESTVLATKPIATPLDRTVPIPAVGGSSVASVATGDGWVDVGTIIKGRFELEEKIGQGGMGEVYRAKDLRQEEAQDRQPYVALKVLSPEFARDSQMRIALQREARKAHSLAHPNVITVYDFDREGDTVFLTMELLTGQTLKELIAEHSFGLPREQAFDILRGMCLGLAYAHNKGIVHSDFKTGNVFYTDERETKILDFGIARAVPSSGMANASEHTTFDVSALGALTPSYASPEMLAGKDPGPRDDVFALALVAYQLLTGKHPFGYTPADQAAAKQLVPEPPKALSKREWRALSAALSFDGDARPADAAAFLKLLEGTSPIRKLATAAVLGLVITTGYVVYDSTTEVLETRPDVAFEELPTQTQGAFNNFLTDARTAERFNDLGSALDLYVRAYRLHPRNPEVVTALDKLVERIHQDADQLSDPRDRQIVVANLKRLADVDDFLSARPALTKALAVLP